MSCLSVLTAKRVAKAKMQILAAGNSTRLHADPTGSCTATQQLGLCGLPKRPSTLISSFSRGFTLLELLVVIAIIAIATAGVSLALRDSATTALEREAQRLAAVLEAGRSQSRTTGLTVRWQPAAGGFVMASSNTANGDAAQAWLTTGVTAQSQTKTPYVLLGPEPIIAPQRVRLLLDGRSIDIATDGLQPFRIETNAVSSTASANAAVF
jgi:general secretion pathway protein H